MQSRAPSKNPGGPGGGPGSASPGGPPRMSLYSRPTVGTGAIGAPGAGAAWSSFGKDGEIDHKTAVAHQLAQAQAMILDSHDRTLHAVGQRREAELQRLRQENRILRSELAHAKGEPLESRMQSRAGSKESAMTTRKSAGEEGTPDVGGRKLPDGEPRQELVAAPELLPPVRQAAEQPSGIPNTIQEDPLSGIAAAGLPMTIREEGSYISPGIGDSPLGGLDLPGVNRLSGKSGFGWESQLPGGGDGRRQFDEWGAMEILDVWSTASTGNPHGNRLSMDSVKLSRSGTKCLQEISQLAFCDEPNETAMGEDLGVLFEKGRLKHLVVHPTSKSHLSWATFSLILVSLDIVFVPFQLLDPEPTGFDTLMVWVSRIFWSVDIGVSFFSGYFQKDGFIEMRISRIAWRYIRTWLLLDLVIVSGSWLELFWAEGGAEYARMGKASRSLRFLRMLRLLRMFRLWHTMAGLAERLQDEKLSIMTHVGKIVVCIVGWSHVTACVWYGLGAAAVIEGEPSWVSVHHMADRDLAYRYFTSLHWSLAQFSGGMDEVTPENVVERVFVICVFILAFLLAAAFTSILTSSITRLHILTSGQSALLSMLRKFLAQNAISNALAMRVQRNAQLGVNSRHIPEYSVELLRLVSTPLKVELHYELFLPILQQHPFFAKYNAEYPHIVQQICHYACSNSQFAWGDTVFSVGETPLHPKMYFIRSGTLEYMHITGCADIVSPGMWLAEPVMWVSWMHRGLLKASGECVVLELDAAMFQGIVKRFDHPSFSPWHYASKFHAMLHDSEECTLDLMLNVDLPSVVEEASNRSRSHLRPSEAEHSSAEVPSVNIERPQGISHSFLGVTPATSMASSAVAVGGMMTSLSGLPQHLAGFSPSNLSRQGSAGSDRSAAPMPDRQPDRPQMSTGDNRARSSVF